MQNKTQSDKLKDAARELQCDEEEKHFDAMVRKLAKAGGKQGKPRTG